MKTTIFALMLAGLLFSGCVSYCPRGCGVHMDHELAESVNGMYKGKVDDVTMVLRITGQQECTQYVYKQGKEDFSAKARWEVESNGTLNFWWMVNPFSNEKNDIPTMSDTTAGIVSKDGKSITLIFNNEHQFEVKSIIE